MAPRHPHDEIVLIRQGRLLRQSALDAQVEELRNELVRLQERYGELHYSLRVTVPAEGV